MPRGLEWVWQGAALPEGAFIEARDGYTLLHYRGHGLVDRLPILGFLLDRRRMALGVALADHDAGKQRLCTVRACHDQTQDAQP